MKKLVCLMVMLVLLCMFTLPATAEMKLEPNKWTKPFDYTCETYMNVFSNMQNGQWEETDAEDGYQLYIFRGDGIADVTLLGDNQGRVLAIATELIFDNGDGYTDAANAFLMGISMIPFASHLIGEGSDGHLDETMEEALGGMATTMYGMWQASVPRLQESVNSCVEQGETSGFCSVPMYADIADHIMNFEAMFRFEDEVTLYQAVFSPENVVW